MFIKDIEIDKNLKNASSEEFMVREDNSAKVEGTGSGFIWDKFGHIVSLTIFSLYLIPCIS